MKALVFTDVLQVTMQNVPEPVPGSGELLLRVKATGICGSDMAGFLGHSPRRKPPLILGHETIGTIEQLPPDVEPSKMLAVGQRVVVNPIFPCGVCAACRVGEANICAQWRLLGMDRVEGAFADFVAVPVSNVFALPDSLPDARAVMIEPLANSVHLFRLIRRHNFGTLGIIGAGTQGCLMVALAYRLGYRDIAITDINPQRLDVARQLGAKFAIDVRGQETVEAFRSCFPGGADTIIDAHGSQAARAACVGAVRKGGEILLLGLHEGQSTLDFATIVRNEIRLQGSFAYTPEDFARSMQLIENGDIDLSAWTQMRPLEEGQAAFDTLRTDPGSTMKIVLTT